MANISDLSLASIIELEFPLDEHICYLNHAAVSPWPLRTAQAVKRFADENTRFGAMYYASWVQMEGKLREQITRLINARSADEISLLKNTSEALSVVACGIDWRAGDNIVSTDEEFPSNRIVWESQARHGVELRQVPVSYQEPGNIPESALISACDKHTRVMAVSSVQYGSGLKLNLKKLGEFCRNHSIYFCVDAIQSIGAHRLDVQSIQADFVMADAHKWMCGPEGIALFYCREQLRGQLKLNQFGWHMVDNHTNFQAKTWSPANTGRRFECGSPNMLGVYALSASLSLLEEIGIESIEKLILNKIFYLYDNINNIGLDIIGNREPSRRAGIITFKSNTKDNAEIQANLLKNKVACAYRGGGIRFSPHFYTDLNKINKSLEILSLYI